MGAAKRALERNPPRPFRVTRPRERRAPGGEKGSAARRRAKGGRAAYSLYVERPDERANEADGPLSPPGAPPQAAACFARLPLEAHEAARVGHVGGHRHAWRVAEPDHAGVEHQVPP